MEMRVLVLLSVLTIVKAQYSTNKLYRLFYDKFGAMETRISGLSAEIKFLRDQVHACTDELQTLKDGKPTPSFENGRRQADEDDGNMGMKSVLMNAFATEKETLRKTLSTLEERLHKEEQATQQQATKSRVSEINRLDTSVQRIESDVNNLASKMKSVQKESSVTTRLVENIGITLQDLADKMATEMTHFRESLEAFELDGFCQIGTSAVPGHVIFDTPFNTTPHILIFGEAASLNITTSGFSVSTSEQLLERRRHKRTIRLSVLREQFRDRPHLLPDLPFYVFPRSPLPHVTPKPEFMRPSPSLVPSVQVVQWIACGI